MDTAQTPPDLLSSATQSSFLHDAGRGTLPPQKLSQWLVQDTHYTRHYVRFLGAILNSIPLPFSSRVSSDRDREFGEGCGNVPGRSLEFRIFDLVTDALVNIQREMQFFEDVVRKYELDLPEEEESEALRAYGELFADVSDGLRRDG
ncbi:MAG: hypothetical protein Q9162_006291 [Coniocarpon cinnabarinum]